MLLFLFINMFCVLCLYGLLSFWNVFVILNYILDMIILNWICLCLLCNLYYVSVSWEQNVSEHCYSFLEVSFLLKQKYNIVCFLFQTFSISFICYNSYACILILIWNLNCVVFWHAIFHTYFFSYNQLVCLSVWTTNCRFRSRLMYGLLLLVCCS